MGFQAAAANIYTGAIQAACVPKYVVTLSTL